MKKELEKLHFGIRTKMMLACSSLVICVIFVCIGIFNSFYETLRMNASRSIVSEISDMQMKLELFFSELDQYASRIFYSSEIRQLLSDEQDSAAVGKLLDEVCEEVHDSMDTDIMISVLSSQMRILSSSYQGWVGKQRVLGTHWIDKINRANGEKILVSSYTVSDAFLQEGIRVISLARLIQNDGKPKGIMIMDIPVKYIQKLCDSVNLSNNDFFAVVDDDGIILYHTNEKLVGTVFRQIPKGGGNGRPYFLSIIDHREMLVSQISSNYSGYTLLGAVETQSLYRQTYELQQWFLKLMAGIGLLALLLSLLFAHHLAKPLVQMSQMMRRVERGDFTPYAFKERKDEIGYLEKSFNMMLGQLADLIDREYKSVMREQEAEYKVLAASIQPHFIYNTLETISMTAYMNDDIQTMDMLNVLADLFRFSTIPSSKLVSLGYECEHARSYLQLCQMRKPEQFVAEWAVDETLKSCLVLPFLLQPIVENVMKYAFANVESGGRLSISAERCGQDGLRICVEDNGEGMSWERIDEISAILQDNRQEARFMALKNIHDRIRLNFGKEYGLAIQQGRHGGLKVVLFLPILKEVSK